MRYIAVSNVPGYLPMDDEPSEFDNPRDAWAHLVELRERDEENGFDLASEAPRDAAVLQALRTFASAEHRDGDQTGEFRTNADGTGSIYGCTPGYDGNHDLGLVYSVMIAEEG